MDVAALAIVVGVLGGAIVIFLIFVLPIWIIAHYLSKSRAGRSLAAQDEKLLADLWEAARRVEEWMTNLERVLGAEPSDLSSRMRETAHG